MVSAIPTPRSGGGSIPEEGEAVDDQHQQHQWREGAHEIHSPGEDPGR